MIRPLKNDLGRFLRSRRARLTSYGTAAIPAYGEVSRVPGLRVQEVALLAGVSANYYARLESGETHQMSDSVFEAIVNALQLDRYERQYLARLTWPAEFTSGDPGAEQVHGPHLALVKASIGQAGGILGRRADLLGANRLFRALFGFRSGQRVNMVLHLFLEPTMRDLLLDWESVATDVVAHLRLAQLEHPGDRVVTALIGELSRKSPEFVRIWATHPMAAADTVQEFNHPQVGRLALHVEWVPVPDSPGQRIHFLTPGAGSDSADRLRLLSSLAA